MKEKIIDFSNGIFSYSQPRLKIEPGDLVFELDADGWTKGSFVISCRDERRVKGILYTQTPGLTLKTKSFFARAARIEYEYEPRGLRAGEGLEDRIWLETDAGEYELPVKVKIRRQEPPKKEEIPLPALTEEAKPLPVPPRKGRGRSEGWKRMRSQEAAFMEFLAVLERERRNGCTKTEADKRLRELADNLTEWNPESAVYPLLDAYVMLREGRREEAGWTLRRYEKARLYQQKDMRVRAVFYYVFSLYREEDKATAASVSQLQKIYQKRPEEGLVAAFLLELDPKLQDLQTRYMFLEKQFRAGTRNRLLYQEAWRLLKEDMALFTKLNAFTVQVFGWTASHGLLTEEAALTIARQAGRIRNWSPFKAGLLKACYQAHPSKETAGAVCAVYIRGHRTDGDAFVWYEKGVELDAKITNLYEYFMYALPEQYPQLLPKQVLLYFQYHNTLTGRQKADFYCNLVRYGTPGDPVCEEHRRRLQEYLLKQLMERRLNEQLAWLYGRCLLIETLDKDMLEALADLLFLRKLTCQDRRICQAEVSYEQLEDTFTAPLSGGCAYIPVYTPDAKITLIDSQGRRYQRTVPYELKRIMIEPGFLQKCAEKLKDHLGLNLYRLDGKGAHTLKNENISLAWKLMEDDRLRESYQRKLKLEILAFERKCRRLEKLDPRLEIDDPGSLGRREQADYIDALICLKEDEKAFRLLKETGCREVDARMLLKLLMRLTAEEKASRTELLPFARQVFAAGVYTEQIVGYLADDYEQDTKTLLAVWKAGKQFRMSLPKLEEQIIVQALFTENCVNEVFPVYLSMDDRGGDNLLGIAYLNYLGYQEFVKGADVPEGLFDSLEHHLIWDDSLAEAAVWCYLKQLSMLLLLSNVQRRLVQKWLKELAPKRRQFSFIQKLLPCMEEEIRPDDREVIEYRCDPSHRVVLHYVLEYHGKRSFDYVTERLYPVCGGIFTRSFILFYGERLTWFVTETAEDGTEISTECRTIENRREHFEGDGRYQRLCRMQRALDFRQERPLKRMMAEYEELTGLAEEQFHAR